MLLESDYVQCDAGRRIGLLDHWARGLFLRLMSTIHYGHVVVVDDGKRHEFGALGRADEPSVYVNIHHERCYRAVVLRGSIGAGEAYMQGHWTCDDLVSLIRIVIRNGSVFERIDKGWSRLAAPFTRLRHWLRRNTPAGSRRNIAAHYDLGNDFYALFLDETMTYSCGIFESAASSLREASVAKYERVCKKLQLTPDDHVLEIGSGWGGFAVHAASVYGCRVTTTTLSKAQQKLVRQRVIDAGLQDRVEVLLQDYRELRGVYSKIVSIEMIEAVGHANLVSFFQRCSELLRADGQMLIQAITIPDHRLDAYVHTPDFINTYIFPGGSLPSIASMALASARASELRITHLEDLTPHYATTLRAWRLRFLAQLERVRSLGFPTEFIRMWEYYLSYCEGGFLERYTGVVQIAFSKPLCRLAPILPPLR